MTTKSKMQTEENGSERAALLEKAAITALFPGEIRAASECLSRAASTIEVSLIDSQGDVFKVASRLALRAANQLTDAADGYARCVYPSQDDIPF